MYAVLLAYLHWEYCLVGLVIFIIKDIMDLRKLAIEDHINQEYSRKHSYDKRKRKNK